MSARDAFKVLAAIGAQPVLLSPIAEDARKAVLKLLRAALKSPELDVKALRQLHDTVGGRAVGEAVSTLSRTAAGEVIKRLDRRNPQARGAAYEIEEHWARARILALASGAARPFRGIRATPRPAPNTEALAAALREARRIETGGRVSPPGAPERLKTA